MNKSVCKLESLISDPPRKITKKALILNPEAAAMQADDVNLLFDLFHWRAVIIQTFITQPDGLGADNHAVWRRLWARLLLNHLAQRDLQRTWKISELPQCKRNQRDRNPDKLSAQQAAKTDWETVWHINVHTVKFYNHVQHVQTKYRFPHNAVTPLYIWNLNPSLHMASADQNSINQQRQRAKIHPGQTII